MGCGPGRVAVFKHYVLRRTDIYPMEPGTTLATSQPWTVSSYQYLAKIPLRLANNTMLTALSPLAPE